jgi:serine/threonine protein kinase
MLIRGNHYFLPLSDSFSHYVLSFFRFTYSLPISLRGFHNAERFLLSHFDRNLEDAMTFLSKGLRSALNFLHKHGVTHCDLKLDNIVVHLQQPDRPLLQLIDLGLADQHGAGTGLNRLVAFFPQHVVDTWSNSELDNFAASQCCLHLFVSHKCRGSKASMWRELDRMYVRTTDYDDCRRHLFRVVGQLLPATPSPVHWLSWLRSVSLEPSMVLGKTLKPKKCVRTWTKFCDAFTVNDKTEVTMLNMVDDLFPFSHRV